MNRVCESHIEQLTLAWFEQLDRSVLHGPDIATDEPASERTSYSDVVLYDCLQAAVDSLNPLLPAQAKEEALRKVLLVESPSPIQRNRAFHKMLRDGITVEYRRQPSPSNAEPFAPSPFGRGRNTVEYQREPSPPNAEAFVPSLRGSESVVDDPGGIAHDLARLADCRSSEKSGRFAVNQFIVIDRQHGMVSWRDLM